MGESLLWVHHDALSKDHPVFDAADDARPVFIWDAKDIERRGWTLKRCVFVMECVEAMDVEILQGDAAQVLSDLAPKVLFLADMPDPAFQKVAREVAERSGCEVQTIAAKPFTDVPANTDMGRFFRFWNTARRSALSPTAELSE